MKQFGEAFFFGRLLEFKFKTETTHSLKDHESRCHFYRGTTKELLIAFLANCNPFFSEGCAFFLRFAHTKGRL